MSTLHFLAPLWFLLLFAVFALVGIYIWRQVRRRHVAMRFTNVELLKTVAPRGLGVRRHVGAVVMLLALLVLTTAMARPAVDKEVPVERGIVILAIDISGSMAADDVEPTRMEAAKEAATLFMASVSDNYQVGLVTFEGAVSLDVPPTSDHALVIEAIDELEPEGDTAIGSAIVTSLKAIEQAAEQSDGKEPPARIVLLSDGETRTGTPNSVAGEKAADAGVPVTTIAFGTPSGYISAPDGTQVPVAVNGPALERIANDTDGEFYEALTAEKLKDIYKSLGSLVDYETADREVSHGFFGVGFGLVLLSTIFSLMWTSRLV